MIKLTKEQFAQWTNDVNKVIANEVGYDKMRKVYISIETTTIFVKNSELATCAAGSYVFITNAKKREVTLIRTTDMKIAKAKCHKDDSFSPAVAVAICFSRLNDWVVPVPIEYKTLAEMKTGEEFHFLCKRYKFICKVPGHEEYVIENEINDKLEFFEDTKDFKYAMV